MPLLFEQRTRHQGILGLWRIKEDEAYFLKLLSLSEAEQQSLESTKGRGRRIQWLAVRYLLHHLSGRSNRMELHKDEHSKPFLPDSSYHISISHSHEMAAVLAAPVSCGIDIQFPVPKIKRIVHKFCSSKESQHIQDDDDLETMHIIWGAKECLYKAYGRKQIEYKSDIHINSPSTLLVHPGVGILRKDNKEFKYEIHADVVLDYILTYCFETSIS